MMYGAASRLWTIYSLANAELAIAMPGQARAYLLRTLLFLASVTLLLVTLVEMRRGFLFPDYVRIGAPTPVVYFDPRQLPLLLLGGLGAWLSQRRMAALEKAAGAAQLKTLTTVVAVAILCLLVADLFIYRGVPAYKIASTGNISVGQAIPATAFPGWAQPFRDGLNYLVLVWHATVLAILLGALFLTLMAGRMRTVLSGRGFNAHVTGAALAIPQPFCSCCSAPIGATLYRQGASLGTTLAFVVSSPMLNVTGLLLAALLLPWEFAVLRLAGGVVVGVFATYAVSAVAVKWTRRPGAARLDKPLSWPSRALQRYSQLFDFERLVAVQPAESPAGLVAAWLTTSGKLSKVIVPVVLLGSVATAAVVLAIPSPQNNALGVIAAGALGTLVMVPTWAEIPIVGHLIQEGLTGPAATLLLTLPAVSVPCLAVITGAMASLRVSLLLGLAVFAIGVLAGSVFLLV